MWGKADPRTRTRTRRRVGRGKHGSRYCRLAQRVPSLLTYLPPPASLPPAPLNEPPSHLPFSATPLHRHEDISAPVAPSVQPRQRRSTSRTTTLPSLRTLRMPQCRTESELPCAPSSSGIPSVDFFPPFVFSFSRIEGASAHNAYRSILRLSWSLYFYPFSNYPSHCQMS